MNTPTATSPMFQLDRTLDDAASASSSIMTDEDEECVSFLMTLKYRSVTPDMSDDPNRPGGFKKSEVEERTESFHPVQFGTEPTLGVNSNHACSRPTGKNDTTIYDSVDAYANSCAPKRTARRPSSLPLCLPEDEYWLSGLQCYIRSHCVEFFAAKESDVTTPSSKRSAGSSSGGGRRGPITLGRVGIRCVFCRDALPSTRASQATSFPFQISGVYGAVVMMQCRHFPHCSMMPEEVRNTLATLKRGGANSLVSSGEKPSGGAPGRQQYWAESARKLGLVDSPNGIRFATEHELQECSQVQRQEQPSAAVLADESQSESGPVYRSSPQDRHHSQQGEETEDEDDVQTVPASIEEILGESELVSMEDRHLVPDYLFLAMAQMKRCQLTEGDKVGCYKGREVGFTGMCCKHCGGQPGFGKYFPATVRSLAQTTTSQTILKHVGTKCRHCPANIRDGILALQRDSHKEKAATNHTNDGKPRYGSRKVFFMRVWARLHGEVVPEVPANETPPPSPMKSSVATTDGELWRIRENTDEVSSLDDSASSDNESSYTEPEEVSSRGPRLFSEEESDSDISCDNLVDNKNRRVIVRSGGSRPRPMLPTKKALQKRKRASLTRRNAANNKRFKGSPQ